MRAVFEKILFVVLQVIGHVRATHSPICNLAAWFDAKGIPKDHREFVNNLPKIATIIKLIEQNKKDRPDAGPIIYSEVGVEFFLMIYDYFVKESGVHIVTGMTSNNERINIQTTFCIVKVKVVIGSPVIKEGLKF